MNTTPMLPFVSDIFPRQATESRVGTANREIRTARIDDSLQMAEVDSQSWPSTMATSAELIRRRCDVFAEGQLVAQRNGKIVAVSFAQRINASFLEVVPKRFDSVTDRGTFATSHDPNGQIYQLVSVAVAPAARGDNLGRRLVDQQMEYARTLPGVRRIVGFTRPAGFHRHPELTIDQYVRLRRPDGRLSDPFLSFHLDSGARLVSIHAGYREADSQARGYGVLIEYPLRAR